MRIVGKILLGLLAVVLVLALAGAGFAWWTVRRPFPQLSGEAAVPGLQASVEVIRDDHGVPNLYADNPHDLFLALGYVHAQDRFWEMDVRRHITSGRLSEMFGKTQVDTDAFLRTLGWRHIAEQEFAMLSETSRANLDAYAAGVNQYLSGRSNADVSLEYSVLRLQNSGYTIEPWDPIDSIAWLKALAWQLVGNMDEEVARTLTAAKVGVARTEELYPSYPYARNGSIMGDALTADLADELARRPETAAAAAVVAEPAARRAFQAVAANLNALGQFLPHGEGVGSNSWVISGELTESGKPLLANDPHLAPAMPSLWYQVGMHCRTVSVTCDYDVSGWSMAGLPGIFIGHNADIAWGFTNLGPDVSDLVLEQVEGSDYVVDGRRRPITTRAETITVAGGDPVEITVRSTESGPLISDVPGEPGENYVTVGREAPVPAPGSRRATPAPRGDGYAVALRWTALTARPTYDAFAEINTARTWRDFRAAARLLAVPAQNLVYADTAGTIGYQAPGEIPVRTGYTGKWPVPGWDSRFAWSGMIPFRELPSVRNPAAGWITTANQEVLPGDDPLPLMTDPSSYGARARKINEAIAARVAADSALTVADMNTIQLDASNDLAGFLAPKLAGFHPGGTGDQAVALLADWDRRQPVDSAGAAYFNAFYKHLITAMITDEVGDSSAAAPNSGDRFWEVIRVLWNDPDNAWWDDTTTAATEDRDATVTAALRRAADELTQAQGSDPSSWRWGTMHTVSAVNQTLGTSGIGFVEAIFNRGPLPVGGGGSIPLATGWTPHEGYQVDWIPSMRQVIDLANPDSSTWINFTGNSGHAYNANYVDQFDTWATGGTYPWRFSPGAVRDAGTNTLTLRP